MDSQNYTKPDRAWISAPALTDINLQEQVFERVASRIAAGKFRAADIEYIRRLSMPAVKGSLQLSDVQLEKLRRICQLAEVDLVPARITSHRPLIGPVIVAAKRVLFSILKVLLKDTLRKQRDFNAAVIAFLAESGAKLDK